jgi:hypothetical protein
MKIDISQLNENELLELNRQVVERLRMLRTFRTQMQMLAFATGDRVCFQPEGREVIHGTVTRCNKKTVSITADCGHRWNVPPTMLRPVGETPTQIDMQSPAMHVTN